MLNYENLENVVYLKNGNVKLGNIFVMRAKERYIGLVVEEAALSFVFDGYNYHITEIQSAGDYVLASYIGKNENGDVKVLEFDIENGSVNSKQFAVPFLKMKETYNFVRKEVKENGIVLLGNSTQKESKSDVLTLQGFKNYSEKDELVSVSLSSVKLEEDKLLAEFCFEWKTGKIEDDYEETKCKLHKITL